MKNMKFVKAINFDIPITPRPFQSVRSSIRIKSDAIAKLSQILRTRATLQKKLNDIKNNCFYIHHHQDPKKKSYQTEIEWRVKSQLPRDHEPWNGGIGIAIIYKLPILKSMPEWEKVEIVESDNNWAQATKPDKDNLDKPVQDAMEGLVYTNDSRIYHSTVEKVYSETPGIEIKVSFYRKKTRKEIT